MMVVSILAVLLLVALPAFQNYTIRTHRAAAKAEMLELANREQQYLLSNRAYTNDPADLSYEPPDGVVGNGVGVDDRYTFELSTVSATTMPAFEIRAIAKGDQVKDGNLWLNSQGERGEDPDDPDEDKWAR